MAVGDVFTIDEKQGKSLNRIDTKANWEAVNPVLAIGEMGIEKDGLLQNIKIGDGVTPWNSLQYMFKSCPYEVGDILVTMNATDPAVRWPGTTWEVFAPGRVLIGAGKGTDVNGTSMEFKVGATGGEYSHQLTVGELATHTHHLKIYDAGGVAGGGGYVPASSLIVGSVIVHTGKNETLTAGTFTDRSGTGVCTGRDQMDNAGSNTKHNNLSSFIVTYCYKRKS